MRIQIALPLAAALVAGASLAGAQSLVTTRGTVVAAEGMAVPGSPLETFGGTFAFDHAVIDDSGAVAFRGKIAGASSIDQHAIFYGRSASDLAMVVRGGDPAPGLTGVTLDTGTSSGLGRSVRLSSNGVILFCSSLSGAGISSANDSGIFVGLPTLPVIYAQEGDAAPGTVGATLSSSLASLSHQPTGLNLTGRVLFRSKTTGGDTVSTNDEAWFAGVPGQMELVQRKGDSIPTGEVIGSLGFVSQMNILGQTLHDETLSTTLGSPPATTGDDKTLWVHTPGLGNALVVREGDPAPGTLGATFTQPAGTWSVKTGSASFNNNGEVAIIADLDNGDVFVGVNDRGIFVGPAGGLALAQRRGDPAPGTDANFDVVNSSSLHLNNKGEIAFQSTLVGGTSSGTDDSGVWAGAPGALRLVLREGDPAPGVPGATLGSPSGRPLHFNDRGQVLQTLSLNGGPGGSALYAWDPDVGLRLAFQYLDTVEVLPGVMKYINTFGGLQFSNGDGRALSFNHAGDLVYKMNMTDATDAIVKVHVGSLHGLPGSISAATGGVQVLDLDGGATRAGALYLVAGSASGTSPGIGYGGRLVPLNLDPYLLYSLANPNGPVLGNTLGTLDSDGRATATVTVPSGVTSLVGIDLNHAFVTIGGAGGVSFVSEAASLTLAP